MSRAMITHAKEYATAMLIPELLPTFQAYLWRRYGVHPDNVVFKVDEARQRIVDATFLSYGENERRIYEGDVPINGETDGEAIWIDRDLTFESMVITLIHEALHDSVFILRTTRSSTMRGLSTEDEHAIMSILGVDETD